MICQKIDALILLLLRQLAEGLVIVDHCIAHIVGLEVLDKSQCLRRRQYGRIKFCQSRGGKIDIHLSRRSEFVEHRAEFFLCQRESCPAVFQGLHACRIIDDNGDIRGPHGKHRLAECRNQQKKQK